MARYRLVPSILIVSVVLSVVLTVVLNVGLRAFPKAGDRAAERLQQSLDQRSGQPSGPRVKVFFPWKAMLIGSLVLTVLVNLASWLS